MASQHLHKKEGTKQVNSYFYDTAHTSDSNTNHGVCNGDSANHRFTVTRATLSSGFKIILPLFYFTECLTFHCSFLSFMSGHFRTSYYPFLSLFFFLLKLHSTFRLLFCIPWIFFLYSKLSTITKNVIQCKQFLVKFYSNLKYLSNMSN